MSEILLNISRYILIFVMLFYVYLSFRIKENRILSYAQNILTAIVFTICSGIVLYHTQNMGFLVIILLEIIYAVATVALYRVIYPECSMLVLNNMIMLLSIGFIMAFRLAPDNAFKQFIIVVIGTTISFFVPFIMKHKKFWVSVRYVLAIAGIVLLGITLILGKTSFGANLSITIGSFSIQPSEFVKLFYVLAVAGVLSGKKFRNVIISAILAALHVIVLILSNDLGAGLIFFVVYIIMLFVATGRLRYLVAGLLAGGAAAVMAYNFVGHDDRRYEGS